MLNSINNSLIQYKSGFIDGKSHILSQIGKQDLDFRTTSEIDSWYRKGYNDGNNYYLNLLTIAGTKETFSELLNNQNTSDVILECYEKHNKPENGIKL